MTSRVWFRTGLREIAVKSKILFSILVTFFTIPLLAVPLTVDKEEIRKVVKTQLEDLRGCFEKNWDHLPEKIKIVAEWEFAKTGIVKIAKIVKDSSDPVNHETFETCITSEIKTWKFPTFNSENVAIVRYPFVFQKQN